MADLTPEDRIAKLESDLEQANAARSDALKQVKKQEAWGRALQTIRDDFPDHFKYAEARAFGREASKPQARPEPVATPEEPMDDLQALEQRMSGILERQQQLLEQKLETALRRLDGVQAEQVHRAAREAHPDLDEHQEALNAVLEKFPQLGTSPDGMDIAATYAKRNVIAEQARKSALEEVAQKDRAAFDNFVPEPTSAQAPTLDLDQHFQEGDSVHSALDRFFTPGR